MSYKTILVSLNQFKRCDQIIEAASRIAVDHGAHMIGLFVAPAINTYPSVPVYVAAEVIESQVELARIDEPKIQAVFDDVTKRHGIRTEWRSTESAILSSVEAALQHAHQCDLIVTGQPDQEHDGYHFVDFTERLIMESGRPVVMVPKAGSFSSIGTHVMIAWNATREAARASFDALPALEKAREVTLAWVDPQKSNLKDNDLPGAELATTLARHGVNVKVQRLYSNGVSVGDVLLNHVSDSGADMVVMGAYGHSKLREYVFGGVTKKLLDQMTVPVLMAH